MPTVCLIAVRTSGTAINTPTLELRVGANQLCLMSIEIVIAAATASSFGLGKPAAMGVNPTSPVTLVSASDLSTTVLSSVATSWSTAPTGPAKFIRRSPLPATIGSKIIWEFHNQQAAGLWLPPNSSLVLWNISAVSAADVSIIAYEV